MILPTGILDSAIEDFDEHPEQKKLVQRIGVHKRKYTVRAQCTERSVNSEEEERS